MDFAVYVVAYPVFVAQMKHRRIYQFYPQKTMLFHVLYVLAKRRSLLLIFFFGIFGAVACGGYQDIVNRKIIGVQQIYFPIILIEFI